MRKLTDEERAGLGGCPGFRDLETGRSFLSTWVGDTRSVWVAKPPDGILGAANLDGQDLFFLDEGESPETGAILYLFVRGE